MDISVEISLYPLIKNIYQELMNLLKDLMDMIQLR